MREEFVRLGIRNAHSLRTDARNLPFAREFNRVLVDAPCTNSGLFMRTPSARWKAGSRDIVDLQDTQRQILTSAATRVAQNGSLVYSTCSVLVEENEMAVERFLRSNPDFQLANADLPEGLPGLRGMTAARRFYPHIHECNGFFIARLTRI
jgi:16S rRNA C967 or C1407 C5-methylase (RsmB/RsmF family)